MESEVLIDLLAKPYAMGGWLGMPYEGDDNGCLLFLFKALREIGIETSGNLRRDARHWKQIEGKARFGDVAVFQDLEFSKYHVALMLDSRRAVQSSKSTNGVGKIDISRDPWANTLRGIYRHKEN